MLVANKLKDMKPLLAKDLTAFMQRFENFQDAEFRSLEIISPLVMQLTFALQDAARSYDWITVTLEFNDIVDASLVQENRLHLIDMSEGASLSFDELFTFKINSATFFIKAKTLKFQEGSF